MRRFKEWREKHRRLKENKKQTRESIRREFRVGLKEELMFASGLFIGLLFGVVGNFFGTAYFRYFDELMDFKMFLIYIIAFVCMILIFILWVWNILRKMKKEYYELLENKGIRD